MAPEIHLYHLVTDVAREQQEVAAYRSNWIDYTGAFAEIWLMHNWSGGYETPYARHEMVPDPTPRSCGRPFSELLQVRAGGLDGHNAAVVACCMVLGKDGAAVLGHLDDQSIADVVSGEAYEALRAAHRDGRFRILVTARIVTSSTIYLSPSCGAIFRDEYMGNQKYRMAWTIVHLSIPEVCFAV